MDKWIVLDKLHSIFGTDALHRETNKCLYLEHINGVCKFHKRTTTAIEVKGLGD